MIMELSHWMIVKEKIELSKIKRFRYKELIGESLTSFITRLHEEGCSANEIIKKFFNVRNVRTFLIDHPEVKPKLYDNVTTSISARIAEQTTHKKRIKTKQGE